jgi:hypothetical protein
MLLAWEMVMSSLKGLGGIFICYRRADTAGEAGRLYDRLSARFGEDRVFRDVETIPLGDFTEKVIGDLSKCNIVLALIGRRWSTITDSKGRRIDNPDDPVRIEIETALQLGIQIVPVLVDGAMLPRADDLPTTMRPLIRYQTHELNNTSFHPDATRLIEVIGSVIGRRQASRLNVIRIHAPAVDVPVLAEALRQWYEDQGLETIMAATPIALVVQCRTRRASKHASRVSDALTVILCAKGEDLLVEIGSAKWLGKAAAAKASATGAAAGFTASTVAGSAILAAWNPVGLAAVALIYGGVGAGAAGAVVVRQRRQSRLSQQTISFLQETAPTYVRGA